ncbi:MAG: hypothetical protein BWZ10_02327 [candidate division BRC1 bacterium ADurb.BinA364]|nr:MAG: hypothetical protein BWZ10_02327 [candidate division BRC1 bacterium ADurb.BinA364]
MNLGQAAPQKRDPERVALPFLPLQRPLASQQNPPRNRRQAVLRVDAARSQNRARRKSHQQRRQQSRRRPSPPPPRDPPTQRHRSHIRQRHRPDGHKRISRQRQRQRRQIHKERRIVEIQARFQADERPLPRQGLPPEDQRHTVVEMELRQIEPPEPHRRRQGQDRADRGQFGPLRGLLRRPFAHLPLRSAAILASQRSAISRASR